MAGLLVSMISVKPSGCIPGCIADAWPMNPREKIKTRRKTIFSCGRFIEKMSSGGISSS